MRLPALLLGMLLLSLAGVPPAAAQRPGATPLGDFIKEVAYLWSGGDARALAELMPAEAQVLLDTGRGMEAVETRHAAAALRELFAGRESVSVRPVRVTVAGSRPPRGFGELAWSFRNRGAPGAQTGSVYVGVIWSDAGWRISELRLMP
jgi:hypothetical protein